MASARGTWPGCALVYTVRHPFLAHVGCGDSVIALSRCAYSRENAESLQTPVRIAAPSSTPVSRTPADPWLRGRPSRISPLRRWWARRQDLHDGRLADRRGRRQVSQIGQSAAGGPSGPWRRRGPCRSGSAARALERPGQRPGRRGHQGSRVDPRPHREPCGPAAGQLAVAPGHGGAPDPQRGLDGARAGVRSGADRPRAGQLEDPFSTQP